MKRWLIFIVLCAGVAGCDCESNCDQDYRDCLDDPSTGTIECDVGYDQCLMSCSTTASASPDGG